MNITQLMFIKHIEELKDLYKALLKIEEISYDNDITLQYAHKV